MATEWGAKANAIIARLAAVDRTTPTIDTAAAEWAITAHFAALGLPTPPIRWVSDAEAGYAAARSAAESAARSAAESAAWSAAESAARSAAESAAWSAARSAARSARQTPPAIDRYIGIWLPFLDAYEAGLWLFFPTRDAFIAVPRPVLRLDGERLHCADGPAVSWPGGAQYYFWRGVQIPADIVLHPERITVPRIDGQVNAEVRRVMVERYGPARFLVDGGAVVVHRDETGTLYQRDLGDDEPVVMVCVRNSTPEPDGSSKDYFIRVPPQIRTARAAVAWTFGKRAEAYKPVLET